MNNLATNIQRVNSTTYADVAGIALGIDRLPGEQTPAYVDRLYRAAASRRDHSYQGMLDEVASQLGLKVQPGILISPSDPETSIVSHVGQITFIDSVRTTIIPTLTIGEDSYWSWKRLSKVVAEINILDGFQAQLLISDAPAIQISKQGNVNLIVGEAIDNVSVTLQHRGIIAESVRFNLSTVPEYVLDPATGQLAFSSRPLSGLTISYQHRVLPYELVCSEVGMFGLLDKSIANIAVGPSGALAYQLREIVQIIMREDRSYWTQ